MTDQTSLPGSWKFRRRFLIAVIAFCMICVLLSFFVGKYEAVSSTVVVMAFTTITGLIGSYIFGATWDDNAARAAAVKGYRPEQLKPVEEYVPGTFDARFPDPQRT